MRPRIARDRRRAGVRVVLRERDEALLRALARFRIAGTDDLRNLFFSNVRRDTAATRLRRLYDGGLIQARSDGLNEQNLYFLGPEGVHWAQEHGIAARKAPEGPSAHHLAIVRLWAGLAAALAASGTLRLLRFEPDWELRARFAGSGAPIVPDAAIEIVGRPRNMYPKVQVALEVDLTTERPSALQRKLAGYDPSPYFDGSGLPALAVVLFGAGERRSSSVQTLLAREWAGEGFVFGESEWPAMLLGHLAQPPLTGSPSGRGSPEAATALDNTASGRQGEGLSQETETAPPEPLRPDPPAEASATKEQP